MTEKEQLDILEEWLRLHKGLIFKVVRAFTLADHDDLFQEIIIQIWHSIPAFRQESSVTTWLYRIALNTAVKWTKKEKKHTGAETLDNIQQLLQENRAQIDERLTWLYEEIYKLDEIDRSVTLLLLEGFSYREMSAILGISEMCLSQIVRWNFIPMGTIMIFSGWESGKLLKVGAIILVSYTLAFYVTSKGYQANKRRKRKLQVLKQKLEA